MRHITIDENKKDQRLDRFVAKLMPKMGKNKIQKLIRTKKIKVNKKRATPDYILKEKDTVNIYIYDELIEKYRDNKVYTANDFNLDIIYEDDNIIIIDKPSGRLSHAASPKDYGNNIVDMMTAYLIKTKAFVPDKSSTFSPAIVNRLDRNTQGLILGAKNYESLKYFNELFRKRDLNKLYEALVLGKLNPGTIDLALEKNEDTNLSRIKASGKKSLTKILSVEDMGRYSLVKIDLLTGRTHQIRAHLSHINKPIIGDNKYGNRRINSYFKEKYGLNHQLLHAYKLTFPDEMQKYSYLEGKSFISKRSEEFENIVNDLKKN